MAIQQLTKKDIFDFYETFISPKSEFRAKVSVHLVAQGQDNAAKMPPAEKLAALEKGIAVQGGGGSRAIGATKVPLLAMGPFALVPGCWERCFMRIHVLCDAGEKSA